MEYRACHNLAQIYTFSMFLCLCIDWFLPSVTLSLSGKVLLFSSSKGRHSIFWRHNVSQTNTDVFALTMSYHNLMFIHLSPSFISVWETHSRFIYVLSMYKALNKCIEYVSQKIRRRNWMFVVNFEQQGNLFPLLSSNQKILCMRSNFRSHLEDGRRNYFAGLREFLFLK